MIRWRFILTRLVVIVAVLVLLRWGLGPVVNFVTVRGIQAATGAKVEIGKTRIGMFPPRVHYTELRVADPRRDKAMRDLFRADSIDLVIDGDALLKRRWVAREGRITGLHIGAKRDTSGHLEKVVEPTSPSDHSPSMLSHLLAQTTEKIQVQSKQLVDDLETVRRSKQIRAEWEADYASLVQRARKLEKQIRSVRDQARGIENPLRDWPELERTLAQAREARNELMVVRQSIDTLPQRLQADLARLEEARQIDLKRADAFIPGDLSQSENYGIDLIAAAVKEQVQQIRSYMDSGRKLAQYTVVAPESDRSRGSDYNLGGGERPSVLVRRCEVGGVMRASGDVYQMTGILENLTPTPEKLAEPTRARLRLEGPETVRVEYIRDCRHHSDVDLLTLHWPTMKVKAMQLGDRQRGGLSIEGGQRELWVQIRSEGDQIAGRLVSKQLGAKMHLTIDPSVADTAAAVSLSNSLAAVDRIEIDARFQGSWKDLDLSLTSNIGRIFQQATRQAMEQQVMEARQMLAAKVDKVHAQQTEQLREWLASQQTEARSLLASADQSIEEMSQKVLEEVGDADAYLGRLRSAIRGQLK